MNIIDLRSDTVTKPSDGMRRVIADADVGDDVYGEDPTTIALEEFSADLLGKEASLFCSSGTQSNLLAILSHCQRGDEYIAGQNAHAYIHEGGGAAVLGGVQPQPLNATSSGMIPLDTLQSAIKPDDYHFARSRLVCLENTYSGACLPDGYTVDVRTLCDTRKLSMHLDGARLFNAVVESNEDAATLTADFDSVSVCLSKGLGAPIGSVLCGSNALIRDARRWRKMLGGGTRQAGMMAAAGLFALQHNIDRLSDDHENARRLYAGLQNLHGVSLRGDVQTNMVFVDVSPTDHEKLHAAAADRGIVLPSERSMRLVTHLDVNAADVDRVIDLFRDVCEQEYQHA